MRLLLIVGFVVLVVADCWTALTVFNSAFRSECDPGECDGAVYWGAVGLIASLLVGLCWATWREWNRIRPKS